MKLGNAEFLIRPLYSDSYIGEVGELVCRVEEGHEDEGTDIAGVRGSLSAAFWMRNLIIVLNSIIVWNSKTG